MRLEIKLYIFSYIVLIFVMFVLPFYTAEGYSIIRNTTSQLGAQNTPNSWIMNLVFTLIGLASVYAGWSHYNRYWFHRIVLLIFGLSLVLTAIYSHAPIDKTLEYNMHEDKLHSHFATVIGFFFTILAISTGLIKKVKTEMVLPVAIGIIATGLSVLMFKVESYTGIWQRLIFLFSFGWMIFEFNKDLN